MDFMEKYMSELESSGSVSLRIKVTPKMSKTEFKKELSDGTLKLNIKSAPEKGKGNKEITGYLAALFSVSESCITILTGETSPMKTVVIRKN